MAQPKLILSETAPSIRLGRYELGRELGRGFSSIVYEATDTLKNRRVALKVLTFLQHLTPARRQEMAERFEREARAISALSHPAIVSIYEVGHAEDGRQFIVMQLLEGESLRARLERTGPLLRSEALPLMVQIADALQYAHGRGIIHRDVKPDNVFLCPDGTAKLMDFGVAHVFADDGLTQTGTVVGSPAYMSPEQINGRRLDGRSDVFSLAATLAEALTGRKPFDAPNIPAVMNRILHQPPQLTGIPSGPLRKALEHALAKNPQARTPSAGAFAEALRRVMPFPGFLETTTGTQVMPRPLMPEWERVSPDRWKIAGLAAAGLGLAALAALPFLSRPHAAVTSPARVLAVKHTKSDHIYDISPYWHRAPLRVARDAPKIHSASAAVSSVGSGRITETFPAVETPQLTQEVLNALRDQNSLPAPSQSYPSVPVMGRNAGIPQEQDTQKQQYTPRQEVLAPPPSFQATANPVPSPAPEPQAPELQAPEPQPFPAPQSNENTSSGQAGMNANTAQAPQTSGNEDAVPRLILQSPPQTPSGISPDSLPATVTLLVSVNEEGDVYHARVTQSSGDPQLDAAAIKAVMQWQYEPAFHHGQPCSANVAEQVNFSQ